MKVSAALVAASLLLNIALGWAWTTRRSTPPARADAPAPAKVGAPATTSLRPINPKTWEYLAGDDPRTLATRLRAKGFPPHVIRAIVTARVRGEFADRYREIAAAVRARPYWLSRSYDIGSAKMTRARHQLERDVSARVGELLGSEVATMTDFERRQMARDYGDLPDAKLDALLRIQADYEDMKGKVRNEAADILLPEDREKIALLDRERDADIARLLSPEERADYELHTSRTTGRLRSQLVSFRPTEEEFRALYTLRKQVDDAFPSPDTPAERKARAEAEAKLRDQIAAALGPERYADYERTTDPTWMENDRFARQYKLPPEAVAQLGAVQKELTQRATDLRRLNAPPEQLEAQLAALRNEADLRLAPIVGSRLLPGYKDNAGWLRALSTPRPASGRTP